MDEALQRLLKAESEAERITREADAKREQMLNEARAEAKLAEQRLEERIPEIRASFVDKASRSAEQTLTELRRRYDERHVELRTAAQQHEREAIDAVVAILLNPQQS